MPPPKGHKPYNVNGEGGAPKIWTKEKIEAFASEFEAWLEDAENFWFKDFAIKHKLNANLFGEWAKQNDRFAGVLLQARQKQEAKLFKCSLNGSYNSSMVKFALNVHHDWIEKKEVIHKNDEKNPVPNWIVEAAGKSKDLALDDQPC